MCGPQHQHLENQLLCANGYLCIITERIILKFHNMQIYHTITYPNIYIFGVAASPELTKLLPLKSVPFSHTVRNLKNK